MYTGEEEKQVLGKETLCKQLFFWFLSSTNVYQHLQNFNFWCKLFDRQTFKT